jgi:hypothetical protein
MVMLNFSGPRAFARWMIEGDRLLIKPDLSRIRLIRDFVMEVVLYRDGPWQCELIVGFPGKVIPRHRHLRADSCDLALGGDGLVTIGSRVVQVSQTLQRGSLAANLIRVPRSVWHGGELGAAGGAWLSFQHWIGEPDYLGNDWEDQYVLEPAQGPPPPPKALPPPPPPERDPHEILRRGR